MAGCADVRCLCGVLVQTAQGGSNTLAWLNSLHLIRYATGGLCCRQGFSHKPQGFPA